jgi:hypothetical protein
VSREAIEASEAALEQLVSRRFEGQEILVVYLDGIHFGEQCVMGAVGVDSEGKKHGDLARARELWESALGNSREGYEAYEQFARGSGYVEIMGVYFDCHRS